MFEFRSSSSNKYGFTKSLFRSKSAFTLVELLVVITILAILALVAFLMMSDATVSARDSNRLASIKNIYDASQLQAAQQRLLPLPDQAITLTVSGTDIGWQGYMSGYVAQSYGYSDSVYDPRDNTPYIYRVNQTRNKSQYLAYLENGGSISQGDILLALGGFGGFGGFGIDTAQATDFSKRVPYVYGDRLGVVLSNTTNEGANVALGSGGTLDLGGGSIDSNYSVYVNEGLKLASVEGTGAVALKTNGGLDQVIAGGSVVGRSGSEGSSGSSMITVLDIDFNGIDGSTTAIDKTGLHTVSGLGISSASNFGYISNNKLFTRNRYIVIDDNGSPSTYLSFPGDFEIEIACSFNDWSYAYGEGLFRLEGTGGVFDVNVFQSGRIEAFPNSPYLDLSSTGINLSSQQIIKISRESGVLKLYIDGILKASKETNYVINTNILTLWSSNFEHYIDYITIKKAQ